MNADVLTTRVADRVAVITLGSARRIYFDEEMGDALTEALHGSAGDPNVRVVIVIGGALAIKCGAEVRTACATLNNVRMKERWINHAAAALLIFMPQRKRRILESREY
jgi:enoyl-CoA hydratase/carnithine racemase